MAQRQDEQMTSPSSPAAIRHQIELTRRRIDQTLEELERRVEPRGLFDQAEAMFRDEARRSRVFNAIRNNPAASAISAAGLVSAAAGITFMAAHDGHARVREEPGVGEKVREGIDRVKGKAREWKERAAQKLQRSEEPVLGERPVIGEGPYLAREEPYLPTAEGEEPLGRKVSEKAGAARRKLSDAADSARQKLHEGADKAREQAGRARESFWQRFNEHPLAIGAATLAAGVVAGQLLPGTRLEDEAMGRQSDQLAEQAKQAGRELGGKAASTAEAAVSAGTEEARRQGESDQPVTQKVEAVAKEVAEAAKQKASDEGLTPEQIEQWARERTENI